MFSFSSSPPPSPEFSTSPDSLSPSQDPARPPEEITDTLMCAIRRAVTLSADDSHALSSARIQAERRIESLRAELLAAESEASLLTTRESQAAAKRAETAALYAQLQQGPSSLLLLPDSPRSPRRFPDSLPPLSSFQLTPDGKFLQRGSVVQLLQLLVHPDFSSDDSAEAFLLAARVLAVPSAAVMAFLRHAWLLPDAGFAQLAVEAACRAAREAERMKRAHNLALSATSLAVCAGSESAQSLRDHLRDNPLRLTERDEKGWTLLHFACYLARFSMIQMLLQAGASADAVSHGGLSPLHLLVWSDFTAEQYQALLGAFAPSAALELPNRLGETPLHLAVKTSQYKVFKFLLSAGANVDAINHAGETPLHYAIQQKDMLMIQELLAANANPDLRSRAHLACSDLAVTLGSSEILMLTAQAGIARARRAGHHPPDQHNHNMQQQNNIQQHNHSQQYNTLQQYNMQQHSMQNQHSPPPRGMVSGMISAARLSDAQNPVFQTYLAFLEGDEVALGEARINAQDESGWTALHFAVVARRFEVAHALLRARAAVLPDYDGMTPLHHLVAFEQHEGFAALLGAMLQRVGKHVDQRNSYEETPLHLAVLYLSYGAVGLLLAHGACPNAGNLVGETPLHYAVIRQDVELVQRLIDAGADLSMPFYADATPLEFCKLVFSLNSDLIVLFDRIRHTKPSPHKPCAAKHGKPASVSSPLASRKAFSPAEAPPAPPVPLIWPALRPGSAEIPSSPPTPRGSPPQGSVGDCGGDQPPSPAQLQEHRARLRERTAEKIVHCLSRWMQHHPEDFWECPALLVAVAQWITELKQRGAHRHARTLQSSLRRMGSEPAPAAPPVPVPQLDVLAWDAQALAQQLCLLDQRHYRRVSRADLLAVRWQPSERAGDKRVSNLSRFMAHADAVRNWVLTSVVCCFSLERRTARLSRWIELAYLLRLHNNFNLLFSVLSALCSSLVSRLRRTWAAVDPKLVALFSELNRPLAAAPDFALYREAIRAIASSVCIPFLDPVLLDLHCVQHLEIAPIEQESDYTPHWDVFRIIQGYLQFQPYVYEFAEVSSIQDTLTAFLSLAPIYSLQILENLSNLESSQN